MRQTFQLSKLCRLKITCVLLPFIIITFRPISDLERYLSLNKEKNFVKSHGKNTYDFVHMQAADKIFIECENHMFRIGNRQLIEGDSL